MHAALGFPTKATWIRAINNGNLATSPGPTVEAVTKFFPCFDEMQKGQTKQQHQNVRFMTVRAKDDMDEEEKYAFEPGKSTEI